MTPIRTDYLRFAYGFDSKLQKLQAEYLETKNPKILEDMHDPLYQLTSIIYRNHQLHDGFAHDVIVTEMVNDIISRYLIEEDFQVFAFYKFIRLSLFHVRDRFIRHYHKKDDALDDNCGREELLEEPRVYGEMSSRKLIRSKIDKKLNKLGLVHGSYDYYSALLRSLTKDIYLIRSLKFDN